MNLLNNIQNAVETAIKKLWPEIKISEIEVVAPPNPEFGDYSCAAALGIAKQLKTKPLDIADQLKDALGKIDDIKEITVTEPGFVNFFIDYQTLAKSILESDSKFPARNAAPARKATQSAALQRYGRTLNVAGGRIAAGGQIPNSKFQNIVIEHTSVNPNKAAHIGHLRNACLGDSLARLMKYLGHKVEVQNYIDDLGLQVADSVVAFETFGEAPDGYKKGWEFDKWLWKIYADINKKYEGQPKLLKRREEVLQEMEEGKSEIAKQIVEKIVTAHLKTFRDFGIKYDILVYEHDIVRNQLWDNLFNNLRDKKLVIQAKSGDNKGAWIVEFGETDREDKILVRSNGVPTYTAKDIAYQLWKFGQSQMTGYKRKLTKIDKVINVIDERQSYPQAIIQHVLTQLGYKQEADNSIHLAYGVVKISDKALKQLGEVADNKSVYSMSGRSGIGVIVDRLLDAATALQIKEHMNEQETARQIATGSIRYYMLKTRPQREIIFDFDEALRTDGNTGVYLQYAYARANNILEKATSSHLKSPPANSPKNIFPERSRRAISGSPLTPNEKALIKILSEAKSHIMKSADEYDPSLLCDYAYSLATTFAKFYETNPVIRSEEPTRSFRVSLVDQYNITLGQILDILGVPKLPRI